MKKINIVMEALDSLNLSDVEIYDMRNKSPFFDFLVIASANSQRQLQAAIAHVTDDLTKNDYDAPRIEGKNSNSWVLIDCKDIIINVFTKEERAYYNLEKMLVEIEKIDRKSI